MPDSDSLHREDSNKLNFTKLLNKKRSNKNPNKYLIKYPIKETYTFYYYQPSNEKIYETTKM